MPRDRKKKIALWYQAIPFNDQPLDNPTNRHNGTDKEKGREGRGEDSEEETEEKS